MKLPEFLQKLATCEGNVSVTDGVVTFVNGTSFNLAEAVCAVTALDDAFGFLLADVENIACGEAAYGFPVENEQHPFHESVLRARAARKSFANLTAGPRKLWWIADDKAEADRWSADLTAKGAKIEKVEPHPAPSTQVDVVFSLDPARSMEILGHVPDVEEWLDERDEGRQSVSSTSS